MNNNFVKKILLTSTIVLASSGATASPLGTFYVKVGGGTNIMSKHKGRAQTYKSNLSGLAEIGVGYNLLNTVRTDLTFTHYFSPEHKASSSKQTFFNPLSNSNPTRLTGHLKANINTYMVNGYIDLIDLMLVKVFVGGGIGIAQVKQKYSYEVISVNNISMRDISVKRTSGSTKRSNNLSYSLTGGIATTITPIADVELAYAWNDFGKTKSKNKGKTTHYKGSNIVGRLRFNI